MMADKTVAPTLAQIRRCIENACGRKVRVKARLGRRSHILVDGVIEQAYDSLFTVLTEAPSKRRMSFTYGDVLTHTVVLCAAKGIKAEEVS